MFRRMMVAAVLALACSAPLCGGVNAMIKFENKALEGLSGPQQAQVVTKILGALQGGLAQHMSLSDFSHYAGNDHVAVKLHGEWRKDADPRQASDVIRQVASAAAETLPGTKLGEFHVKVEAEDGAGDAKIKEMKEQKEAEIARREKARPSPRLDMQMKGELFEELTILDVPLVRAMDHLGRQVPVSYVLHPSTVGRAVYVRMQNASIEDVLTAIADSTGTRIEKRGKYVTFVEAK